MNLRDVKNDSKRKNNLCFVKILSKCRGLRGSS